MLGRIRQTGVLRVGMEPEAPPLHFINDRKQEDGFDFRLAGIVAEGLGAKRIQVVEADYEDLPDRLRAGEIDVIMAGYVPDPSIDGVVWSNGYLDFGLCLIVHEGMVATYRSVKDLAGKRIAIYDDPAAERWVQQNIPGARISKFSGDDGWFEAVEKDQADALIYDYPFAAEEIKAHPQNDHRAVQPEPVEVRGRDSGRATTTSCTRSTPRSTSSRRRRSMPSSCASTCRARPRSS